MQNFNILTSENLEKMKDDNSIILCPICQGKMSYWGDNKFYIDTGIIKTLIMVCNYCNLFNRIVTDEDLQKHFLITPYTDISHEIDFFDKKNVLFKYTIDLISKELIISGITGKPTLVDFGCAYGHLLEIARDKGFNAIGIETARQCVDYTQSKGFAVYSNIDEIEYSIHIITILDTLYYIKDPLLLLEKIRNVLVENGIICININNRNWMEKISRYFGIYKKINLLGDMVLGFSYKSLLVLLEKAGFVPCRVIFNEKKKATGLKHRLLLRITPIISYMLKPLKMSISPDILIIARKNS